MLAFRFFSGRDTWGALNLCSRHPPAFEEAFELVGQLPASQTSVALPASCEISQLTAELNTRVVVVRATGLLWERHDIGAAAAQNMLLAAANSWAAPPARLAIQLAHVRTRTSPGTIRT